MCGNHYSNPVRPIRGSWDQIWPPGALQDPRGPPKGPFGAKTGPFGGPGGPEEAIYQVKMSGDHDYNPVIPIGSSCDQIWSPGALRVPKGPPKGPFGAKTGPLGGPGGPEEAKYQVKVSGNHDSSPVRPIGSSWDQIWPPGALRDPLGPQQGLLGPTGLLLGALEYRRGL